MNINFEKLEKKHWFEDKCGKEIPVADDAVGSDVIKRTIPDNEIVYYRICFPMELHDMVDEYCYHPKNLIVKWLCRKSKSFYKIVSKGKDRTFKPMFDGTTSFGSKWSQDCIVAMVNSGDFTLEQAIWTFANSCERCMNSLLYKYLDGKEGYPEYSDEWKKANTVCDFCKKSSAEFTDVDDGKNNFGQFIGNRFA